MYDPSKPPTPPGQMGITSGGFPAQQGLPTQQPRNPVSGPPSPSGPPLIGSSNPWSPENYQLSQGTKAAQQMAPGISNLGPPESVANPAWANAPGWGSAGVGGRIGIDTSALRSYLDNYIASIRAWREGGRVDPRPHLDVQSLLGSLFNPPAPAPAPAGVAPGEPNPSAPPRI